MKSLQLFLVAIYSQEDYTVSKKEKLIKRLLSLPTDFTFEELERLLSYFGFIRDNAGRTSGSEVRYYAERYDKRIVIHRPHPRPVIPVYQLKKIIRDLKQEGFI